MLFKLPGRVNVWHNVTKCTWYWEVLFTTYWLSCFWDWCCQVTPWPWWRLQIETLSLCTRNSPVTGELPAQRPVTWSFDVFFGLRQNQGLNKQSWSWWFETPSRPIWHHCNVMAENLPSKHTSNIFLVYVNYSHIPHAHHLACCDQKFNRYLSR